MTPTPSTPPLPPSATISTSPVPPAPVASTMPLPVKAPSIAPLAPGLSHINTTHRGSKRKRDRSCSPAVCPTSDLASPPSSPRILRTHIAHLRLGSTPMPPIDFGAPSSPLVGSCSPRATKSSAGNANASGNGAISPLPSPKRTRRASISSAVSNASDDESDDEQLQNTRMSFPVPAHLRNIGPSPLQNSFSAMFTLASSPPKTRSVTKAAGVSVPVSLQPSLMAGEPLAAAGQTPNKGSSNAPVVVNTAPPTPSPAAPAPAAAMSGAPGAEDKAVLKVRSRLLNVDQALEKQGTEVEKLHVLGYGRGLRGKATALKSSGLSKQRDEPQESLVGAAEKLLKSKAKMQVDE